MASIPKQKVSLSKKKADNFEYMHDTADAIIEQCSFEDMEYEKLLKCEKAYHGTLDDSDYTYITNPYNTDERAYQKFPAKIRNYNIIKPVIDLLLGEMRKRNIDYQVLATSSNAVNRKDEEFAQVSLSILKQMYVNELNAQGMETGVETKEVPDLDTFMEEWSIGYRDIRAIVGQEMLDIAYSDMELDEKFLDGFFDWLTFGRVTSYKGAHQNDPVYEIVPPYEIYYHKTPNTKYIEDCDWAVRRAQMSGHQLMDRFYDQLQDRLDDLDGDRTGGTNSVADYNVAMDFHYGELSTTNTFTVYHVTYKTYVKIAFIDVVNEEGVMETIQIDENYPSVKGVKPDWQWVSQVWETYKVMTDEPFHFGDGPTKVQRGKVDNPSSCKLPYNGKILSGNWHYWTSPVFDGIPYQILYNIFHYMFEKTVNKSKDKIALLDINMIPRKHGWDEDKFMYYADALGFAFIDSTAKGPNNETPNFNQFQVLDLSLGNYLSSILGVMEMVKSEWEDTLGINRQRKGQAAASDGASVTERAVFQSSMITENMVAKYDALKQKELQGLLEVTKEAWKDGKRGTYITSDFTPMLYNIPPDILTEEDLGVFVRMDSKENDKLNQMKELSLTFAQNQASPLTIAEIIDSNNMSKVKQKLKEFEVAQAAMTLAQQEAEAEMAQMQQAAADAEKAFLAEQNQLDRDNKIDVAEIQNIGKLSQMDDDKSDEGSKTSEKERHDMQVKDKEVALKEKGSNLDRQKFNEDARAQRKAEEQKQEEIAIKRKQANKPTSKA